MPTRTVFPTWRSWPLRFRKAGTLDVRENAWLLPSDTAALRFNNTPPENIKAADNRELDRDGLDVAVRDWRARHPRSFGIFHAQPGPGPEP